MPASKTRNGTQKWLSVAIAFIPLFVFNGTFLRRGVSGDYGLTLNGHSSPVNRIRVRTIHLLQTLFHTTKGPINVAAVR